MRRRLLAGLAAATMLAAAQKQAPPAPAKPRPFTLPKHETYALGNGMKVTLVPWGTLPVASVGVNLDFGNINESKDQVWMADFLAELMKEGAAGKSGAQLAKEAASLGGGLNFGAGPEESYASMNCLGEFAPKAVKLLSELLLKPDFPAGEVERLRGNLLRRAAVDRSQPQTLAYEAFNKAVYGEHRFGTMYPTPELLKSYTLDQLKKFHAANFGARRAHLYVAGQFDAAAVKQAVEAGFGGWAAGPAPVRKPPAPKAQKQFVLIDQPKAEQSNLYIGLPVAAHPAHPDYIPFQVLDAMLGGTFFSRITTNIREDKGYTYSPGSQVDNYRGSAVWIETADVSTNVTAESIREILKEVGQMRKEPPTEKELQAVKNALTGMFVLRNASPSGVINLLIMAERHGLGDDWLNSYIGKLNAVTRADVQRLAESMLDPAKMTIVVAGDREKIEKTLAPYKN